MANELVLNVTLGETRVARLENGVVCELYIECTKEQGVVGNVYKGKVVRVLPGMQAAFIDIGLERTAFLHASDVVQELTRFDADMENDDEDDEQEKRTRLRSLIERSRPRGSGFIIRTACVGVADEEITADMNYLIRTWEDIATKATDSK